MAAFKHFTACMRGHGIAGYPEAEGAELNLSHSNVNTNTAQFKAASSACKYILQAIE